MDYLKKLDETLETFEKETDKISMIPKLIDTVAQTIGELESGKEDLVSGISEIKENNKNIKDGNIQINKYIENEKEARGEYISVIKNSLLENSQENMKLYNNLSNIISSNMDVMETKINASIIKQQGAIADNINDLKNRLDDFKSDINKQTSDLKSEINKKTNDLKSEINNIKEETSVELLKIRKFTYMAIGFGVLACILVIVSMFK